MGMKKFLMKSALRMKGSSKEDAERIAEQLENNPQMVEALKALDSNKEVKELFEKIQKEVEEKKKEGMNEMYAGMLVAGKYKAEIAKHKDVLAPIMQVMMNK